MEALLPGQPSSLGERIRAIRTAKGLTQRELARRARLSVPFVSRIENHHAAPSVHTLQSIATAMGVTTGDLLDDRGAGFTLPCPVSASARCIGELIRRPGRRRQPGTEAYTGRQIELLRLANDLLAHADARTLAALETVMRSLMNADARVRSQPTRRA